MNFVSLRLFAAVIIALALTILPLPEVLLGLRPPWVLILILYWQFFLPDYFNIAILLIIGLALDVLLSTVLGEHAFALSLVTWLASSKARRFRLFSMGQQMALVGFFCLLYQTLIVMVDASLGYYYGFLMLLGSTAISVLLWPWMRLIADDTLGSKMPRLGD
ncbi:MULTISPECIES: rod shape-determining protein MreD [Legionella]|uniref:Rod shape-determining protein MreD n=1 Tax=Legionella maceachernii TaxID=466 RepID=A0A0W0WGM3_9GAMM|nr:rod shape-determining protein MreD [Legionella maceachernii]KTD31479.1 Rod shape-determining protein MreD [Legionella maceachernii]SJZ94406.1 rod shape-determining protein MreD [Legionella maceachernii]SUP03373.1 Rod shape-determining protein mreD [Legionella maceachernii]